MFGSVDLYRVVFSGYNLVGELGCVHVSGGGATTGGPSQIRSFPLGVDYKERQEGLLLTQFIWKKTIL